MKRLAMCLKCASLIPELLSDGTKLFNGTRVAQKEI